ncbi:MAG: S-layer homology domain-containing protein [Vallitalea sp.]|jgi:hypothetical protein|nr:S-layer homology domain-containing protein [Vallitalea sp.]
MKSRKLIVLVLFCLCILATNSYASENKRNIVGQPIKYMLEDEGVVTVQQVTAVIINNDIEFRIYFKDNELTSFSFFNPPLGNIMSIYGEVPAGTNEEGILRIKCSLEEFKKFGAITIKLFTEYSHESWIYLEPPKIRYDRIPKVFQVEDKNLMEAIKNKLGTDIVFTDQLKKITWLTGNGKKITNLKGLEKLTELIYLDLGNNDIQDISALSRLTKLKYLSLQNNKISDISSLEDLVNLEQLSLKNNNIKDVSSLAHHKKLKELFLANNDINNFSILKDTYKNLKNNDFEENFIGVLIKEGAFKDINFLKANEEKIINHTVNKFNDISSGIWYTKSVAYVFAMGVMDGYSDKSFIPNGSITIDQFIKIVISTLGYVIDKGKDYWAQPYIDKAVQLKIINEGEFINYKRQITRGEIALIIARVISDEDKQSNIEDYKEKIADYDLIPDKYKESVLLVYSKGIISGYPDNTFRYNETASRAGATSIIVKLIDHSARNKN